MVFFPQGILAEEITQTIETAKQTLSFQEDLMEDLKKEVVFFGFRILGVILIILIFRKVIKFFINISRKSLEKTSLDEGVCKFLLSLIRASLYILLLVMVIGTLGIKTTSFAAVIGSAGVTIGLALQGSLANFAGGVLILILKPFRVGDYIIVEENEGTVTEIDIFYTKLLTVDNQHILLPNGELSNSRLTNVTFEDERRLDLLIDIDYAENIKKVRNILMDILEQNEMILKEEHPIDIIVDSFEASSIRLGVRVWVETDNFWKLKWTLMEQIKEVFDENQISIPFNQMDIHLDKQI